jgi:hypothetical protein
MRSARDGHAPSVLVHAARAGYADAMQETAEAYIERMLSYIGTEDPWPVLAATAVRLRQLVDGRSLEALDWTDRPERWSTRQILAHLADAELVTAWRMRSILAVDGVPLQPFDQDTWADAFRYGESDAAESIALFDVNRRATLALLGRVDPARHRHAGMHAERGRESIDHLLRLYAGHDLNHVGQIERLLQQAPR